MVTALSEPAMAVAAQRPEETSRRSHGPPEQIPQCTRHVKGSRSSAVIKISHPTQPKMLQKRTNFALNRYFTKIVLLRGNESPGKVRARKQFIFRKGLSKNSKTKPAPKGVPDVDWRHRVICPKQHRLNVV